MTKLRYKIVENGHGEFVPYYKKGLFGCWGYVWGPCLALDRAYAAIENHKNLIKEQEETERNRKIEDRLFKKVKKVTYVD